MEAHSKNSDEICSICGEELPDPYDDNNQPITEGVPEQLWVSGVLDYSYTGSYIQQNSMKVYWNYKLLNPKTDYVVKYSNNLRAGMATVIITGKGNYTGTIKKTFAINRIDISEASAYEEEIKILANGKMQRPTTALSIELAGIKRTLKNGTDYKYVYPEIKEKGTYEVDVNGYGNYYGTKKIKVTVVENAVHISKVKIDRIDNQTFTGTEINPQIFISYNRELLKKGIDYDVEYSGDHTNVGTVTATIVGKGDYIGKRNITYRIVGVSIAKAVVKGVVNVTYTGEEIDKSNYKLYLNASSTEPLIEGTDYTVEVNRLNAGTAIATFNGINKYNGVCRKAFNIARVSMTDSRIKLSFPEETLNSKGICEVEYQKYGAKPSVIVKDGTKILTEGVDYTVKYLNNRAIANTKSSKVPIAYVVGKGNYIGNSNTVCFNIIRTALSKTTISAADVVAQNRANICRPLIRLYDVNGLELRAGVDYQKNIEYTYVNFTPNVKRVVNRVDTYVDYYPGAKVNIKDIIPAGTVIKATLTGMGTYEGTHSVTFKFVETNITATRVVIPDIVYTQKEIKLNSNQITVSKVAKGYTEVLEMGKDFEIVGYKNNVNKGTAKVIIRGLGNYGGTREVAFKIVAKNMNYKITFDKNDGSNVKKVSYISVGTKLPVNSYKVDGKKFKCWCTKPSEKDALAQTYINQEAFTKKGVGILSFGDEITLYAIWE